MLSLLAFDTATEHLSVAVQTSGRVWSHDAPGGALASSTLIPVILSLLDEAGIGLPDLDAIAFGRGPGAFTGLRSACSVAQGLAFGAGKPVLPIDSLLAVAEDARVQGAGPEVWVLMDARMDEIYAARYRWNGAVWHTLVPPRLAQPQALNREWADSAPAWLAGNAIDVFGERLTVAGAACCPHALPRARALLSLATAAWARGLAVDAALALPLYVRDKVAQTIDERAAAKALAAGASR